MQAGQGASADGPQHGGQEHPAEGLLPGPGPGPNGLLGTRHLLPSLCSRQDFHPPWRLRPHHGGRIHLPGGVLRDGINPTGTLCLSLPLSLLSVLRYNAVGATMSWVLDTAYA